MDTLSTLNARIRATIGAAPTAEQNAMLWRQWAAQSVAIEQYEVMLQVAARAAAMNRRTIRLLLVCCVASMVMNLVLLGVGEWLLSQ